MAFELLLELEIVEFVCVELSYYVALFPTIVAFVSISLTSSVLLFSEELFPEIVTFINVSSVN